MANYPEYLERNALIERIQKAYCDCCENYNGVRCCACGIGNAILTLWEMLRQPRAYR